MIGATFKTLSVISEGYGLWNEKSPILFFSDKNSDNHRVLPGTHYALGCGLVLLT